MTACVSYSEKGTYISNALVTALDTSSAIRKVVAFLSEGDPEELGEWKNATPTRANWFRQLNGVYRLRMAYDEEDAEVLRFYFSKNRMPEVEVAASVIAGKGMPAILEDLDKVNALQESLQLI